MVSILRCFVVLSGRGSSVQPPIAGMVSDVQVLDEASEMETAESRSAQGPILSDSLMDSQRARMLDVSISYWRTQASPTTLTDLAPPRLGTTKFRSGISQRACKA